MNAFAKNLTKDVVFDFLKGLLIASILSLGMIVLFAFCMKWFDLSDVFIAPIVLGIKGLSVFVGAMIAVKGNSKGLFKGALFGVIYITFAFIIFAVLAGQMSFSLSTFLDVVFAALLGGLVGIFKVNRK